MYSRNVTPVFLISPPDFFEVRRPDPTNGAANDFEIAGYEEFIKNPIAFQKEAQRQYSTLKAAFKTAGAEIVELEPKEGLPDLVFTADATLSILTPFFSWPRSNDFTIASNFTNTERQGEVAINMQAIEKADIPCRSMISTYYQTEGTGDNIYDVFRDVFWSGYNPNTSRATAASGRSLLPSHSQLEHMTGIEVFSLAVRRPFFHLDMSTGPLSKGHVLNYETGLQPEAHEQLMVEAFDRFGLPRDQYYLPVSKEDAERGGCNIHMVGDTLFTPLVSDELLDRERRADYEVVPLDVSKYLAAGGAIHCVANNINQQRVVEGLAYYQGLTRRERTYERRGPLDRLHVGTVDQFVKTYPNHWLAELRSRQPS